MRLFQLDEEKNADCLLPDFLESFAISNEGVSTLITHPDSDAIISREARTLRNLYETEKGNFNMSSNHNQEATESTSSFINDFKIKIMSNEVI